MGRPNLWLGKKSLYALKSSLRPSYFTEQKAFKKGDLGQASSLQWLLKREKQFQDQYH